jgi:hypothetical protein
MSIFMIGTQRSGSNLLRLMLNQAENLVSPHPVHILKRMTPLLPFYGDLEDCNNFRQLVDDVCNIVKLNPVPWEGVELDPDKIINACTKNSLTTVYEAVYDDFAKANKASNWCCKSLNNVQFIPEISSHFKQAKFIHLYRDGRDVALSFRKAIVGEKHFYFIAKQWHKDQQLALRIKDDTQRYFGVRYESLINQPEEILKSLCEFLGIKYNSDMLNFNQSREAERTANGGALWSNVSKPLMKSNTEKFRKQASEEDLRIFESVAGTTLDALGYERALIKKSQAIKFTDNDIRQFSAENERLKAETRNKLSPEDKLKRDIQENYLKKIKERVNRWC